MDTEKCRALINSIESGTLGAAAEQMGYTTSAISRMVQSLEEEYGFPLLHRSRSGVIPTDACSSILPHMRQMLYHEECCRDAAEAIRGYEVGTVVIGSAYSFYFRELTKMMAEFKKDHPGIRFEIIEGTSSELIEGMLEHKNDLCIVSKRDNAKNWIPLIEDELLIMLPSGHKLQGKKCIPVKSIEKEPYIEIYPGKTSDNSRFIEQYNLKINKTAAAGDVFSALAMVESGIGITTVNGIMKNMLQGDVVFRRIEPQQFVEIGIVTPDMEELSPAALAFVNYLKEQM